jgi:hypothetical protein
VGTSFHGGLTGKPGRGLICRGLMCSGRDVSRYRGPVGGPGEGGPSTGNFERWMKGSVGMERLSLKRLTAEDREEGLLCWVPWVMKGRLWGRASLLMGAQFGNLEWARLPGTLRDD